MVRYQKGPAEWIITPASGGAAITINRDQQLEDAVLEPLVTTTDVRSQGSSEPIELFQTGTAIRAMLSLADLEIADRLLALAVQAQVVTTGTGANLRKKTVARDLAGSPALGAKVVIKPYIGLLPSTDPNTWVTIPNAKVQDLSGSSLAFGLQTQQQMKFSFLSLPFGPTSIKWILGDETVPDPTPTPSPTP